MMTEGVREVITVGVSGIHRMFLPTAGIVSTTRNITVKVLFINVSKPIVTPSATGYVVSTVSS